MSEQGNYNVLVEVKKTTIWLRKKDAEKPIDGRIKNQGVIMIENKIILIEDDKEIRGMINDYLSGEFEVTAFNDGMSAIQKITSYDEYALALIDLMLPDISGMEIIKIIRKVSKIPIIIITAKDNDIDKSLGLNLGADDYVVKPFSLIELTARIKANIRRARTYQALPNSSIIKINEALQRILKNLIDNAIRHGGDGKYISLRLTTSNGKNIIEIEDRGDGISPQQQKQIFERNYTTARKTSGSGLGLSISKCLAEQIGADLEVYSVQNEQTIFSIILKKLENR